MILRTHAALFAVAMALAPAAALATDTDPATLEHDVRALASDAMEGRGAGTPGYQMAVDYVSGRFADIGLQPGGDAAAEGREWVQHFSLVRYDQARDPRMALVGAEGGRGQKLDYQQDFIGGGLASAGEGRVEAEMVFVGYGLDLPQIGYDDLEGIDLTGKIVLWVPSDLEGVDPLLASHLGQTGGDRFAARGAVGSIMLWTPALSERIGWDQVRGYPGRTRGTTWLGPDGTPYDAAAGMQFQLVASPDLSRRLLEGQAMDLDALAAAMASGTTDLPAFDTGKRARVDYAVEIEPRLDTANVVGMLPGTDPALADQYVVMTAHLDHVGVRPGNGPAEDQLYNGAMDNAVGVAMLLETARLMVAAPPRRPVLFVALGAEELGLLGSSYHAANPGLADGEVAVNVNVDMPILTWPFNDIVAFGADRSNIYGAVASAVAGHGLKLVPDPNPDEGFFFRSDQYSYVQRGVPAVYLDVGFGNGGDAAQTAFLESDYHQPSDEVEGIAWDQLTRFADVAHTVARNVADMDTRPVWNAGDVFGTLFGGPVAAAD
ncbi:M28 family peptidase [Erythrobacter arachoides]|uniref:M28 family peptidase n=1 Tax=Aurantiacibacter arachoides TaxID=1850444 RepID=A0A845A2C5_9SPHN|nr:M28 family peptidase [Aurantiacibacter arachoides]MXO93592.1 M28 family peptidase [Aurantiacibacter arachoides]GGD48211.1 aminopeptidase [Aurantiacibacter arachoides]